MLADDAAVDHDLGPGHERGLVRDQEGHDRGDLVRLAEPPQRRRLLEPDPPRHARLVVGYSGWGPGQLEHELAESSWLLSDVDADLVFNTPPDQMWEKAIRRLGADPATLTMSKGVH